MRLELGDDLFLAELEERRQWIDQNCSGSLMFDELPSGTGREYRFADADEAFYFKMRFSPKLRPRAGHP